jgi:hypothetical protein
MSDTKICNSCSEELTLDRFGIIKKNGKEYIRNVCKTCYNEQAKENKRDKTYKPKLKQNKEIIVDGDVKPEYKINNRNRGSNMSIFTDKEIESLKNIATYNNELMSIVNNRINFEKIEDTKIKKSITISKIHHIKILEIAKNTDKNYSQIVDSLLQKALENI